MRLGEKKTGRIGKTRQRGGPALSRARRLARFMVRAASMLLFWCLLPGTLFTPFFTNGGGLAFWLGLDPLAAVAVPVAAREPLLLGGLGVLLSAFFFGRIFCGWFCPMGATLDGVRAVLARLARLPLLSGRRAKSVRNAADRRLRPVKYGLLALILGAALAGMNAAFWAAPLPLITRFYALLVYPFFLLAAGLGLDAAGPLFAWLDAPALMYLTLLPRGYADSLFLLLFFGALFWLERRSPRFWCRYLCPAGALLALASRRPFLRRAVSTCIGCGRCARGCPMGALAEDGLSRLDGECVVCLGCASVCPAQGVRFSPGLPGSSGPEQTGNRQGLLSRRTFLMGAAGGAALGLGCSLLPGTQPVSAAGVVRPPGALPDPDFLAACLRCGACMAACPTNALQSFWPGVSGHGLFSPVLTPGRGPCDPDCNACGAVCPTGAIAPLPLPDKQWAKTGLATVNPGLCIAYAEGRRCVVCQEVCPYGAVDLAREGSAAVSAPVVNPARCYGCGYCEHHCPVSSPAITVGPEGALRLSRETVHASATPYEEAARARGLDLLPHAGNRFPAEVPADALPPGFSE